MEPIFRDLEKPRVTAFGIASHSPEELVAKLLSSKIAKQASDIGIVPPEAKADTRFKILLFLSSRDFAKNLGRLNGTDCLAFVFSNPIDLSAFVGMCFLDFVHSNDLSYTYTALDVSGVSKSTPSPVVRVKSDFLQTLVTSVKHGSLLNPLMTFVYSLSSANQNDVKLATVQYLSGELNPKRFAEFLSERLTQRACDKLLSLLSTSSAQSYFTAMSKIRALRKQKKPVDLPKIAKATGTSPYELSYMCSVLFNKTSFADSFDKAKNRKTTSKTG